jgi:hypothetical protein
MPDPYIVDPLTTQIFTGASINWMKAVNKGKGAIQLPLGFYFNGIIVEDDFSGTGVVLG